MGIDKGFKLRPFISFTTTLSFMHLIITSVVLYIVPPGRFANWSNWKLFGISKGGWEAQHTIVGFIFIIASIIHLIINWKVFISYIRSKLHKAINRTWEMLAAVLFIVLLSLGSQFNWVPFSSIMNLGETLSNSWEQKTLSEDTNDNAEVTISSQDTVAVEGEEHDSGVGEGMGRKDLKSVIAENGIDVSTAISRLKAKGIDTSPDIIMKDLSTEYNTGFSDIIDIITGN